MTQTAVEWLHEKLVTSQLEDMQTNINLWFLQAKQIEKQNIIDAFKRGAINEMNGIEEINSEDYYNETFKTKQQ